MITVGVSSDVLIGLVFGFGFDHRSPSAPARTRRPWDCQSLRRRRPRPYATICCSSASFRDSMASPPNRFSLDEVRDRHFEDVPTIHEIFGRSMDKGFGCGMEITVDVSADVVTDPCPSNRLVSLNMTAPAICYLYKNEPPRSPVVTARCPPRIVEFDFRRVPNRLGVREQPGTVSFIILQPGTVLLLCFTRYPARLFFASFLVSGSKFGASDGTRIEAPLPMIE